MTRDRVTTPPPRDPARPALVRMLCVSTIEPRKNHRTLMAAYELAAAARPDLELELTLAGAYQPGAEDIAADIHRTIDRHAGRVRWNHAAEYGTLRRLYEACDFTVFPSELEGFGLPIIESLWMNRPCLCGNLGVVAETAGGGGCVTTDVRDPQMIADAMLRMIGTPNFLEGLRVEIAARPLKTWEEYAGEVLAALAETDAVPTLPTAR